MNKNISPQVFVQRDGTREESALSELWLLRHLAVECRPFALAAAELQRTTARSIRLSREARYCRSQVCERAGALTDVVPLSAKRACIGSDINDLPRVAAALKEQLVALLDADEAWQLSR